MVGYWPYALWRHQMETTSALLAFCAGNSPVTGEFPLQRPVTQNFDVFFDLRLTIRFSKQSKRWWFETLLRPLWRHCDVLLTLCTQFAVFSGVFWIGFRQHYLYLSGLLFPLGESLSYNEVTLNDMGQYISSIQQEMIIQSKHNKAQRNHSYISWDILHIIVDCLRFSQAWYNLRILS